jgi:hypothetical protein
MENHPNPPTQPPTDPVSGYMHEAEAQDLILRDKLVVIRRREESGAITTREAADLRVAAMEHHLAACRALRAEYFGDSQ